MRMNQYDEACAHFRLSPARPKHQVKCPAHVDGTASLTIARGREVDLVVHCHAGCERRDILDHLNLSAPVTTSVVAVAPPRIVAEYSYVDVEGKKVAVKQRMEPKSFRWQSWDGSEGRMRSGLPSGGGQALLPLYRLPSILEAAGKRMVFIVEGEKDADTLAGLGLAATCNPEGASGAGSAYSAERWQPLTRAHVTILPDNDEPGMKHAIRIAEVLYPLAASVRIVKLPDLPPKEDVTYWVEAGHTLEELQALVTTSPIWTPSGVAIVASTPMLDVTRPRPLGLDDWMEEAQVMTQPIRVVPTPFPSLNAACKRGGGRQGLRLGWHVVLAGSPGYGKTTIALNMAVFAALKGKRVGIISLEMSRDELMAIMLTIATQTHEIELEARPGELNTTWVEKARLFQAMLDESGGALYLIDLPRSDLSTVEKAVRQMIEDGCEMIVTDYMQRITVQGKPDDYGRMTDISNTLQGLAKQERIVSLALSQFNRVTSGGSYAPKAQGLKGSSALEDDANIILLVNHVAYHRWEVGGGYQTYGPGATFTLDINKNRHGNLASISMFMSHRTLSVFEPSRS